MDINVSIDKEAVERQVVNAIMGSAIGSLLEKAINDGLTKSGDYRDSRGLLQRAIDDAVASKIREIASELVQSKREQIKAVMVEKLTDEVISKMVVAAWAVIDGKLRTEY